MTYEGLVPVLGASEDPYAVAWCSPDPRPVIFVDRQRIQRSLRQQLRNKVEWTTTMNACFDGWSALPGRPRAALADRPAGDEPAQAARGRARAQRARSGTAAS